MKSSRKFMSPGRQRAASGVAVIAIAVVGLATVTTTAFTGALGNKSKSITTPFTTGRVDLSAGPSTLAFDVSNMAPGDAKYTVITVANTGTLKLRYSMTSTSTEDVLASKLQLSMAKGGAAFCNAAMWSATPEKISTGGLLGSTTGVKVFGDAAVGAQTGDRVLVAPGDGSGPPTTEDLCAQVTYPSDAGPAFDGLTTTATFAFNAEQVANNP